MNRVIVISIVSLFCLSSCSNNLESAKESLLGSWQVKEVFRNITATGLTEEDKSGVGNFEFTSTQCDYNFMFNGLTMMNSFEYDFQLSKENAGFTKVDKYDVIGLENYRVRFGDETSDSHENAASLTLERDVVTDTMSFKLYILLEKN